MRATSTFCVPASARTLKLGLSPLVEFKAALDRMRGSRGVYMEAAGSAGKLPAQRIPQAFKEFLQQQAAWTQAIHTNRRSDNGFQNLCAELRVRSDKVVSPPLLGTP